MVIMKFPLAIFLLCLFTIRGSADTARELEALTGEHTRVAWVQDQDPKGADTFLNSNHLRLMGFDSRDGKGERDLLPERGNYSRPVFTPDGKFLLVNNLPEDRIYLYNWAEGSYKSLSTGYVLDAVRDPDSGTVWVYAARTNRHEERVRYNSVVRFPLEQPGNAETVWDKTPISPDSFLVSDDLNFAAGLFPWPQAGVADLRAGTHRILAKGCWTALSPDNSRLFWVFDGSHRNLYLQFADGTTRRQVDIHGGPGMEEFEVYHPRWSNDVRIMCTTGPYKVGGGGNKIRAGGPEVEIYVGRFDNRWGTIEKWVKVTDNNKADFYPDVWVQNGGQKRIRDVLQADAGDILRINPDRGIFSLAPPEPRRLSGNWPGTIDQLVFVWQPGVAGSFNSFQVRDKAQTGDKRLQITHGALLADGETNAELLLHLKTTNEMTLECVVQTPSLDQRGPARIVSFSDNSAQRNFTLGQQDQDLIFRLRTPATGENGTNPEIKIGKIEKDQPTHVVITYRDGNLRAYLNGKLTCDSSLVTGDFSNWQPYGLVLGDELKGDRNWQGRLSHISIYSTAITPAEAAARYKLLEKFLRDAP